MIRTWLCPGHLSVRVGDSSRCGEEMVKKLELHLWMQLSSLILLTGQVASALAVSKHDNNFSSYHSTKCNKSKYSATRRDHFHFVVSSPTGWIKCKGQGQGQVKVNTAGKLHYFWQYGSKPSWSLDWVSQYSSSLIAFHLLHVSYILHTEQNSKQLCYKSVAKYVYGI